MKQFITTLFTKPDITKVMVDPSSDQQGTIKYLEGIGFKLIKVIDEAENQIAIMMLDKTLISSFISHPLMVSALVRCGKGFTSTKIKMFEIRSMTAFQVNGMPTCYCKSI